MDRHRWTSLETHAEYTVPGIAAFGSIPLLYLLPRPFLGFVITGTVLATVCLAYGNALVRQNLERLNNQAYADPGSVKVEVLHRIKLFSVLLRGLSISTAVIGLVAIMLRSLPGL